MTQLEPHQLLPIDQAGCALLTSSDPRLDSCFSHVLATWHDLALLHVQARADCAADATAEHIAPCQCAAPVKQQPCIVTSESQIQPMLGADTGTDTGRGKDTDTGTDRAGPAVPPQLVPVEQCLVLLRNTSVLLKSISLLSEVKHDSSQATTKLLWTTLRLTAQQLDQQYMESVSEESVSVAVHESIRNNQSWFCHPVDVDADVYAAAQRRTWISHLIVSQVLPFLRKACKISKQRWPAWCCWRA